MDRNRWPASAEYAGQHFPRPPGRRRATGTAQLERLRRLAVVGGKFGIEQRVPSTATYPCHPQNLWKPDCPVQVQRGELMLRRRWLDRRALRAEISVPQFERVVLYGFHRTSSVAPRTCGAKEDMRVRGAKRQGLRADGRVDAKACTHRDRRALRARRDFETVRRSSYASIASLLLEGPNGLLYVRTTPTRFRPIR